MRKRFLWAIALLFVCTTAYSQTLSTGIFWEYPSTLVESPARYFLAESGGGRVVLAWQESSYTDADASVGETYISLRIGTDDGEWTDRSQIAGPYPFVGKETRIYSLAVDQSGTVYMVISTGKQGVEVLKIDPGSTTPRNITTLNLGLTTVAPRIFVRADGGLLLFATQETGEGGVEERVLQTTAIVYSRSENGEEWTPMLPFVADEAIRITLHFLPRHAAIGSRDYIVYQARITDPETNRQTNQIFLKISDDNGNTWTDSVLITDFPEFVGLEQRSPGAFNNENAFLYATDDRLLLTWERSVDAPRPQVYYGELDTDGKFLSDPELVTQGVRTNRAPRAFLFRDRVYLLWFDNRAGADHVILGVKSGIVWTDFDLSEEIPGLSQFGMPYMLGGDLFFLWENRQESDSKIVFLEPDRSVTSPTILAGNFTAGERHSQDGFTASWNLPDDSSRIDGFSVLWDRLPDSNPPREVMLGNNDRFYEAGIEEDGLWYLHVAARDRAGNWSEPATISVFRDTTPPGGVVFDEPQMDDSGYLSSNSYYFTFKNPAGEDVAGYSYSFQYLDTFARTLQYTAVALKDPARGINLTEPGIAIDNYDNGLWALSVAAVDSVGNVGDPETLFFRLNKYIPVTYVTAIGTTEDDLGRISIDILGRGFSAGGYVDRIILDEDKIGPPWDVEYRLENGSYNVIDDRTIDGLVLEGLPEGDYWLAVDHPRRGVHFAPTLLAVKPMGKVKFGDFDFRRPIRITLNTPSKYTISFNIVTVLAIVAFLAVLIILSIQRIAVITKDGRMLQLEVRKLLSEELPQRQRLERIAQMKKKGFGLRLKFALVTISLVIATVLIIAFPLTIIMIGTQESFLAEGLEEKAALMLESAASGARTSLPNAAAESLQLGLLTRQTQGVTEALYLTITGAGQDAPGFDYVWATNDPQIGGKINTPEVELGASQIDDVVAPLLDEIIQEVEQAASERLSALRQETDNLQQEQTGIILRSAEGELTPEENARIDELGDQIQVRRGQMSTILLELSETVYTIPEYDATDISPEATEYTFFKPVLYLAAGDNFYYHGLVRLGVSTEKIVAQIESATRQLLVTTGIIALLAIGIGIASALVLSSIIIRPIRRLAAAVEIIRDTEDKEELKGHIIEVKTKDEIADLAQAVNQMTEGLVVAAAANKDLIVGKETQKMFTPLIKDPDSGRKLTTAYELTDEVEFFGYYEGAKGVSGDYFDYARLDDKHYAIIKCDVAGKGVPASLIMVEVATIFLDYFRNWTMKSEGIHLERLVYRINDLVEQRGFVGRFAALLVVILNVETGATYLCHAGDNVIHIYDSAERQMKSKVLPEAPATGVFPSDMVEMGAGFQQIPHVLKHGDSLLLFTDGVEEDQRLFRDENFNVIVCPEPGDDREEEHGNHKKSQNFEEFGNNRIYDVVNAVMSGGTYRLDKYHNPIQNEELTFNFSTCEPTVKESVLAMAALDKVFRMIPDPRLGPENKIRVDVNIDNFLKEHFDQYHSYFSNPTVEKDAPEYVYYGNLREDDQFDDLTILGVRKV